MHPSKKNLVNLSKHKLTFSKQYPGPSTESRNKNKRMIVPPTKEKNEQHTDRRHREKKKRNDIKFLYKHVLSAKKAESA